MKEGFPTQLTACVVVTQRAGSQLTSALQGLLAALQELGGQVVVAGPRIDTRGHGPAANGIRWANSTREDPFAAYAAGLRLLDRSLSWGRIVLLDDSFVALDSRQLLGTLDAAAELDVASLTMVIRPRPCLHADWIVFRGPRTLQLSCFFDWWGQPEGVSERALTDHFAALGLRVGSVFRADRAQCILAVCRALAWGALPLELPADGPYVGDPDVALGLDPRLFLCDEIMVRYAVVYLELLRYRAHRVNAGAHRVNVEPLRMWLATNPAAASLIEEALHPHG